jgi:hypothetical protein
VSDTTTLVGIPSPARVKRARTGRRVFLALIFLLVLAGLGQRLGVRTASVTSSARGYHLRVTYAAMTRPGLDTPFDLEVVTAKQLPDEVTLAVELNYLNLFDKNGGLDPETDSTTSDNRFVYWTFKTRENHRLRVALDAILAMGQQWGRRTTVELLVHGKVVTTATFHTWVAP